MMDALAIRAAEAAVHPNFPPADTVLIVELDGPAAEVRELFAMVEAICRRTGATTVEVAQNDEQRMRIWRGRKAAFAAMGRVSPNYYVQDGVVPRTKLPEVLGRIRALSERSGLGIGNVFHAGDGNLHPLICYDERIPGQAALAEDVAGEILSYCVEAGGSITGEHGVGADKTRLHAADVLRRRPRRDAAGARRHRSAAPLQSRQGAADAAAVRRGARSLPRASGREGRPRRALLMHSSRLAAPGTAADAIDGVCRRTSPSPIRREALPTRSHAAARAAADRHPRRRHQARLGSAAGAVDLVVEHRAARPPDRASARRPDGHRPGRRAARDLNATLRTEGQWLPVESAFAGATIGGMVATNDAGPLRHRFGTPRDLLIGITLALTDGRLVKSGGTVVKNVAGYDLGKLVSGSLGTLAGIVDATFKLVPVPLSSATLVAWYTDATALARDVAALDASQLEPAAFDLRAADGDTPFQLKLRIATSPAARDAQIAAARALVSGQATVLTDVAEASGVGGATGRAWHGRRDGAFSWLPARLPQVVALVEELQRGRRVGVPFAGRVLGAGRRACRAGWPRTSPASRACGRARDVGNVVLLRGSRELKERVDVWGPGGRRIASPGR